MARTTEDLVVLQLGAQALELAKVQAQAERLADLVRERDAELALLRRALALRDAYWPAARAVGPGGEA